MTRILVALLLFIPAAAQASIDACRTGRALEARPLRLSILPTNGTAPVQLLLRFAGCQTTESEPLFGSYTPPTATRTFRAPGVGWEVDLMTEDGSSWTELYVFYRAPGAKHASLVAFLPEKRTDAIAGGRLDWGVVNIANYSPPKFDFNARVVTQ